MKLIGCVKWTLGIYYHNRGEIAMGTFSLRGEIGCFRASKGHRPTRANRRTSCIVVLGSRFRASRRVIDPRAQTAGHRASWFSAAAFARRKRRKDAGGKAKTELSPRTPSCPYEVRKAAAHVWRLWLQRGALNLCIMQKLPSAKSPLEFPCGFRCSRNDTLRRPFASPFRKTPLFASVEKRNPLWEAEKTAISCI